jgi:hypothetical protein
VIRRASSKLVLFSLLALTPSLASAFALAHPENRVGGIYQKSPAVFGDLSFVSDGQHRGYLNGYDGMASGSLVAPSKGVGRWTPKEVNGRTVYQARDIFDPAKRSSWQDPVTGQWKRGSNVQRMADGLAPIGRDGKSVNLHHLLQQEPGALAEVPSSLHSKLPHKMRGAGESFRNDPVLKQQYEDFRGEYWRMRSQDFQPGQ